MLEGPFDPRQGNYAVAGSADYQLGLAQRGLTARYTSGSFGTKRLLALWGPPGASTHTFAGAELATTDGFGQNRDAQRGSAISQYEGQLGERGSYRLTAQAYTTHFHSAGIVREDDYRAGRIGFYDSYDLSAFARQRVPEGGDAARYSLAGDLETAAGEMTLAQQVFVIKRDMRLLENFTGFLLDVQQPLQSLHDQRGDMLDLDVHEVTVGARGAARVHGLASRPAARAGARVLRARRQRRRHAAAAGSVDGRSVSNRDRSGVTDRRGRPLRRRQLAPAAVAHACAAAAAPIF